MMKKKWRQYFLVLGTISIMISFVLSIILFSYEDIGVYRESYSKHEVYNRFDLDFAAQKVSSIFSYLKDKTELDSIFFSESEISHLYDVKILFRKVRFLLSFNLILFLLSMAFLQYNGELRFMLPYILFFSGVTTLALLASLFALNYSAGFQFLFDNFHETFFVDNWLFDVRASNMINLFPQGYFFDIAFFISYRIMFAAVIQILFALILMDRKRKVHFMRR